MSNGTDEESTCHTNATVSTHVDCEQDSFFSSNGTYYDRRACSDGCVYYHDMQGNMDFNCSSEAVFIDARNGTICAVHDQADQFLSDGSSWLTEICNDGCISRMQQNGDRKEQYCKYEGSTTTDSSTDASTTDTYYNTTEYTSNYFCHNLPWYSRDETTGEVSFVDVQVCSNGCTHVTSPDGNISSDCSPESGYTYTNTNNTECFRVDSPMADAYGLWYTVDVCADGCVEQLDSEAQHNTQYCHVEGAVEVQEADYTFSNKTCAYMYGDAASGTAFRSMVCSDGCLWYEENYVEATAANIDQQNIHTECRTTYTNDTSKETCTLIQSPADAYGVEYTVNVCSDGHFNIRMSNGTYVEGSTSE